MNNSKNIVIDSELSKKLDEICKIKDVSEIEVVKNLILKEYDSLTKEYVFKNTNSTRKSVCSDISKHIKENNPEYYTKKILFKVNGIRILSCFSLDADSIDNNNDKFVNHRKDYINCFGVISSNIKLNYKNNKVLIDFTVLDRGKDKVKVTWDYADAINRILKSQYFKDDFKTQTYFSSSIGLSMVYVSKLNHASSFRSKNAKNKFIQSFSVDKCYILYLTKHKLNDFVADNGGYTSIELIPDRELEERVHKYRILNYIQ